MTETQLANVALGHIGEARIMSLSQQTPAAEHCRSMWDLTRDALLRQRHWNFALRRGELNVLDAAPAFGWAFAYQLPSDYILAVDFNGRAAGSGEANFEIEGTTLLSDDEAGELRYVARITDTSAWDASFCEAFSFFLAAAIAPSITTAQGVADRLLQRGEQFMVRSFGPDNLETRPRAVLAQTDSGWLAAREGARNW